MKRFKSLVIVACAIFVAVAALVPAAPVDAQSSASLSIVPRKNYTVEPGKTIRDTLTIRNLDDEAPLELNLRVVDFTFKDDGGAPELLLAEDAPQTTWSMKPFLTVPQSVVIQPKTSQTVDMGVSIPANQGAGSYYSAIVYSSGTPDGGNVGLSASGVTLVFTTIPGDVNEALSLEKLGAYNQAVAGREAGYTYIATTEPSSIAYTLKNDGNVAESPVGSITLKHMFGKEYAINDVNPSQSLALIGQTRTFTPCIKLKAEEVDFNGTRSQATTCASAGLWPGFYSINMDVFYGQNGNRTQEITGSSWFIYLPWWFVIVALIILAIVAYFVWRFVRFVRQGPGQRAQRSGRSRQPRNRNRL